MNNVDPSCHQKDFTCDHWNRAQEGDPRQAHVPRNQYHGIDKVFSTTLPPAAIPSGASLTNSGMSNRNETSHSTVLQTPLPSFLPQQLVWPTMTRTMAVNPSSFYLTSMPGISPQSAFFIPMPVYGCAYPNNSSNSNSNSNFTNNIFHFAPHATASTQGGAYIMTQPLTLPPQTGMLTTQTLQSQSAMYSSMLPMSSNAFPNSRSQDKEDPYHSCLSLKTQACDDNTLMHETSLVGKEDSFLLLPPPACENSSHSRSVKHEPLESTQPEGEKYAATARSYHCFGNTASTEKKEHASPKAETAVAAAETASLSKPRRALSAYNLFFKDQREVMIRRQEEKDEEQQGKVPNSKKRCFGGGRRRRHGINFACMAREIAQLWKNVDPHLLSQYEVIAEKDKKRYQDEKEAYVQQRMNVMETTRKQLEATVSDLVRQKYLEKAASANSSEGNSSKEKKRKRVEQ